MAGIICVDLNGVLDGYTGWRGAAHSDAHVVVDDRAICFRGDFAATLHAIDGFSAHWETDGGRTDVDDTRRTPT